MHDDTVLVYLDTSMGELTNHAFEILRIILDWFKCNKLSLNPSKSAIMIGAGKMLVTCPQQKDCGWMNSKLIGSSSVYNNKIRVPIFKLPSKTLWVR